MDFGERALRVLLIRVDATSRNAYRITRLA